MKTISKLLMMSCVSAALLTGCSDDVVENVIPIVAGDDIAFGASARFEVDAKATRTVYGAVSSDKTYQEVLWENGDMIKIWCDEAAQAKVADYKVVITDSDDDTDSEMEGSEHVSMHLEKQGGGLQWSANSNHTFYAVYPGDFVKTSTGANDFTPRVNLTTDDTKLLTAYVPTQQSPTSVVKDETGNYVASPNMKYAYMVAKTIYNTGEYYGENRGVQLFFQPIVTAVELELKASEMSLNGTDQSMTITSVSLQAANTNLAGEFTINMKDCTGTEKDGASADHVHAISSSSSSSAANVVTMQFDGTAENAVTLTEGKSLTLTLFVNSLAEFEDNNDDLKLMVTYNMNGSTSIKTLKLKKEMVKFKKYAFKNIYLPKILEVDANASNWITKLPDNVLMSQLSVPIAGNAGSYEYSDEAYKEQIADFETQWNYGVRGFELVTSYNNSTSSWNNSGVTNLGECKIVCNKTYLDLTFGDIASQIVEKLKLEENSDECAFIICSYQSYNDSRSGDNYISALTTYVDSYSDLKNRLVLYDPKKTLKDYRGKICLIGRITQEGEDTQSELVLSNVPEYLTYIQGWGSLKDRWNRRYPGYAVWIGDNGSRAGGTAVSTDGIECVEDLLYNTDESSAVSGYPTNAGEANFYYPIQVGSTTTANGAWVQEWSRVADGKVTNYSVGAGEWGRNEKFITWPSSLEEKKGHVLTTFEKTKKALLAGESTVFINSLAGFYITKTDDSAKPFSYSGTTNHSDFYRGTIFNQTTDNAAGGDFATYNATINQVAYEYLRDQAAANQTGPMGLVIMDYVGQGEAGQNLPGMIWQNNFKVPLLTGTATVSDPDSFFEQDEDNPDGNAISWE